MLKTVQIFGACGGLNEKLVFPNRAEGALLSPAAHIGSGFSFVLILFSLSRFMGLYGDLVHPQDALGREFGRVPNLPWDPIERFWCLEVAIIACTRTQIAISYHCGHDFS